MVRIRRRRRRADYLSNRYSLVAWLTIDLNSYSFEWMYFAHWTIYTRTHTQHTHPFAKHLVVAGCCCFFMLKWHGMVCQRQHILMKLHFCLFVVFFSRLVFIPTTMTMEKKPYQIPDLMGFTFSLCVICFTVFSRNGSIDIFSSRKGNTCWISVVWRLFFLWHDVMCDDCCCCLCDYSVFFVLKLTNEIDKFYFLRVCISLNREAYILMC